MMERVVELMTDVDQPLSVKAIAEDVGVAQITLRKWQKRPEFAKMLDKVTGAQLTHLRHTAIVKADRALQTIDELMDSESEDMRLRAANRMLELAGWGGTESPSSGPHSTDPLLVVVNNGVTMQPKYAPPPLDGGTDGLDEF